MAQAYIEHSDWDHLPSEPLVTVAMPTYNHERYLRDAIEGVLAQQTDFPFELIIGEDASTDGSRAIALEYWRSHPHLVRVITADRNVGMHENDARILNAARGRYLAFCEGDDCWHRPDKLQAQVRLLESDARIALVCSSWRIISEEGAVLISNVLRLPIRGVYQFGLDEILAGKVKTVTVCLRTDLAQTALKESPLCKPGLYPFGDAPLWVEASRQGTCLCLPMEFGSYRLSSNSATRPREIMSVYRFIADASAFDRAVLGNYCLRAGPEASLEMRVRATRRRLRALAFLGEATQVREELHWLLQLGARIHFGEYLLYWGAMISRPGTWSGALRKWGLLRWQASARWKRQQRLPVAHADSLRPFDSAGDSRRPAGASDQFTCPRHANSTQQPES